MNCHHLPAGVFFLPEIVFAGFSVCFPQFVSFAFVVATELSVRAVVAGLSEFIGSPAFRKELGVRLVQQVCDRRFQLRVDLPVLGLSGCADLEALAELRPDRVGVFT